MKSANYRQNSFVPTRPSPLSSNTGGPISRFSSPLATSNVHKRRSREHNSVSEPPEDVRSKEEQEEQENIPEVVTKKRIKSVDVSHVLETPNLTEDVAIKSVFESDPSDEDDELDEYEETNLPPEFLNRLRTFPLFKTAPKSFHTSVAARLKLVQHHAHEYIVREGESAKAMYWILKGTVGVTSMDGESIYAELAAGSFFGEIGILFNRPRTATVVSRTKVLLGVLTAEALNTVLPGFPAIERRIRDEAQERLAMQDKRKRAALPSLASVRNHRHSVVRVNSAGIAASAMATAAAPVPGPSLPPILSSDVDYTAAPGYEFFQYENAGALNSISSGISRQSTPQLQDNVDASISTRDFLQNLPIFQTLNPAIIHELALGVEPQHLEAFEYVFHKGDSGRDIYFVVAGEVEVIEPSNEITVNRVLARLGPGQYFGEMSFVNSLDSDDRSIRSADIRAVSSTDLLVVKSGKLELLIKRYPEVCEDFRRTAGVRCANNSSSGSLKDETTTNGRITVSSLVSPPSVEESLFTQWSFDQNVDNHGKISRSVSPVTFDSPLGSPRIVPISSANSLFTFGDSNSFSVVPRKRNQSSPGVSPSVGPLSPSTLDCPSNLSLSMPPLNPVLPPINNFQNSKPQFHQSFQYVPHAKRMRLASVGGARRKSSVLSTGPLPDRIVIRMFGYLSLPQLMKLRSVCRRWRQLLHVAPGLFDKLDLTPWNTCINDKALIQITDFVGTRPSVIDLSDCFHITDEGFSYLVNEIGIGGQIKVIRMRSTWEVSAMAIMDVAVQSVGKFLEEIDLSNCRKVRDDVVERLLGWNDAIPKEKREKDYGFTKDYGAFGAPMPEMELFDGGDSSTSAIGCKRLKRLNLGYCKHLTDKTMYHIALHANERLESLNLTRCTTITDAGFGYWAYQPFPKLKELTLADCTFLTDKAIVSIASAATNLEKLSLNFCCALSDVSIEVLCLGCPNLRQLDISFCGSAVSDSSLVAISLHLRNLEVLNLKGCVRVTRAGIDALLSGCSPLRYINVSQCRNAHIYPGGILAQQFSVKPGTRSAFVTAGSFQRVVEIVL